ncbi:MAG: sugar ABC transporter ATP-binding protein [Geminicoccaceae bacterium]
MSDAAVLAASGVTKRFFGNAVLKDVSIEIRPGRVHALLGENGAGKSTLINLLSGALTPDGGSVLIDGQPQPGLTPATARRRGIAVVQQELSLGPHLSIAENIGLGAMPTSGGRIDYGRLAAEASAILQRLGLDEPLDRPVAELPLGRRQLVEIGKALFRRPRVLILDEPTSSLNGHEVRTLFGLLASLRREGVALLYISHRLNEVLELCDWVTVLKDGVRTADQPLTDSDPQALVRLMVGREPGDLFPPRRPRPRAPAVLDVAALHAPGVEDVSLSLAPGEILGFGGLLGQGQEETLLALYGATAATAKRFTVRGEERTVRSPIDANRRGVAYVPADRKRESLLLPQPIGFNLTLPALRRLARRGLRRPRKEARTAASLIADIGVRGGGADALVQQLSGGNQQKIAVAKWLPLRPGVLLLNDPTRGVDVETKRELYLRLRIMATEGAAIILLSSDTLELVHLCDRVLVFREGGVAADLSGPELTEESIVAASLGVGAETRRLAS